jgi:hypothetical protein
MGSSALYTGGVEGWLLVAEFSEGNVREGDGPREENG